MDELSLLTRWRVLLASPLSLPALILLTGWLISEAVLRRCRESA